MSAGEPAAPRAAAFFDLDRTVIARSSTVAFSRPLYSGGLLTRAGLLRSAYAHAAHRALGADDEQVRRVQAALVPLVAGWEVERVREVVADALRTAVEPFVHEEAVQLVAEHRAAGRDVIVVSASSEDLVGPVAALLGADRSVATSLEVVDGRYTGRVGTWVQGPEKARAVRRLAAQEGYDLAASYAYSDSATDLPMLEAVGHPHAVNPDRALRRTARERGWPVLAFERPVPLLPRPAPLAVGAVGAVGVGAATAGAVWAARRRGRRG
ncbi:HAD family hydrolase [Vallicoccus soli]|uniref:HAD-IB family hydrolase n=1 Tax=Vallicoccus soli TaxID=2339232 RepID=A0A3A3Z0A1_9ACTN|nr:HAD-IB family hydrolase [Vallicoccus soli]RJK97680.1 HAD-IB family hydrolase [Vallicoccus soli]